MKLRNMIAAIVLILCVALAGGFLIIRRTAHDGNTGGNPEISDIEGSSEEDTTLEELEEELDIEMDDDSDSEFAGMEFGTLEAALPTLTEAGYEKTAAGYRIRETVEGVTSERVVTASGNHVTARLSYDYGKNNAKMIKFYNEEEDAVMIMVSSFLTRLARYTAVTEADLDYTIFIGDQLVREGSMDLEEASGYSEMMID